MEVKDGTLGVRITFQPVPLVSLSLSYRYGMIGPYIPSGSTSNPNSASESPRV